MLNTVNPNHSFIVRFKELLAEYPSIDIKAMGVRLIGKMIRFSNLATINLHIQVNLSNSDNQTM